MFLDQGVAGLNQSYKLVMRAYPEVVCMLVLQALASMSCYTQYH
jgi:hypothetical protein